MALNHFSIWARRLFDRLIAILLPHSCLPPARWLCSSTRQEKHSKPCPLSLHWLHVLVRGMKREEVGQSCVGNPGRMNSTAGSWKQVGQCTQARASPLADGTDLFCGLLHQSFSCCLQLAQGTQEQTSLTKPRQG